MKKYGRNFSKVLLVGVNPGIPYRASGKFYSKPLYAMEGFSFLEAALCLVSDQNHLLSYPIF